MTDIQSLIAKCRAVSEAATPGPWSIVLDVSGDADGIETPTGCINDAPILPQAKAIVLWRSTYLAALSVVETAAILMDWDTGDAMCERDRADRRLRAALAAFAKAASDAA